LDLPVLLNGLALHDGWSGAIPYLVPRGDRMALEVFWMNLRVAGRKRLTVPAGTFDCWRLVLAEPPEKKEGITEFWIDREGGFLVQETPGPASYSTSGRKLIAILP